MPHVRERVPENPEGFPSRDEEVAPEDPRSGRTTRDTPRDPDPLRTPDDDEAASVERDA